MKRKSLIMLVCAIVVMSSAAFGTIAYLTDRASVKNTFTVGNVDITLDEAKTNEAGQPTKDGEVVDLPDADRTTEGGEGNQYKLIPGKSYVKDPTVTVKAGKEPAYIRMVVEISKTKELQAIYQELQDAYGVEKFPSVASGLCPFANSTWAEASWNAEGYTGNYKWVLVDTSFTGSYSDYRLTFNLQDKDGNDVAVSAAGEADLKLPPLFDKIKVPGELTGQQLEKIDGMEINVIAQAIQAEGFENAEAAWTAFDRQSAVPTPSTPTQGNQGDNPELPPVTE